MSKNYSPIPPDIKEHLEYDPITGLLRWTKPLSVRVKEGDVISSKHAHGYVTLRFRNKAYLAHRVAWYLMTGVDPEESEVDHRDRDKSNNRWTNLRLLTHQLQQFNTGALGYSWHSRAQKFLVKAMLDKSAIYLGLEYCPLLARIKYIEFLEKQKLNMGTFVPTGKDILGRPDFSDISSDTDEVPNLACVSCAE